MTHPTNRPERPTARYAMLAAALSVLLVAAVAAGDGVPAKPAPLVVAKPMTDKAIDAETEALYRQNPEIEKQRVEHDQRLKAQVARHDQAMRDYTARVQREKTRARRARIVERIEDRRPAISVSAHTGRRASSSSASGAAARIAIGLLLTLAVCAVAWRAIRQLFRREQLVAHEQTDEPASPSEPRPIRRRSWKY